MEIGRMLVAGIFMLFFVVWIFTNKEEEQWD
jgi:hypothetical protein